MSKKNIGENFFEEIQNSWTQALEASRKNMQAIAEANHRTVEGWQTLARRQAEMVTEFIQDNNTPSFAEATTPERFARGAETLNSAYQRTLTNTQELAQLASKCTADAAAVISQRAQECLTEMKSTATKTAKATKQAAEDTISEAAE